MTENLNDLKGYIKLLFEDMLGELRQLKNQQNSIIVQVNEQIGNLIPIMKKAGLDLSVSSR